MWEQTDLFGLANPKPSATKETQAKADSKSHSERTIIEEPVAEEVAPEESFIDEPVVMQVPPAEPAPTVQISHVSFIEEPKIEVPALVVADQRPEPIPAPEPVSIPMPEAESRSAEEELPPLSKADYITLADFRHALRLCLRQSELDAAKFDLSAQQHQALLAIEGFPERKWLSIRELAERLQVKHHTTVELVDRLEKAKYVRRIHPKEDRRIVGVELLTAGRKALNNLATTHRRELRMITPTLLQSLKASPDGTASGSASDEPF